VRSEPSSCEAIRVGIAGQGRSGYDLHAMWLKQAPQYRIVAVADQLPERRRDAEREFGAATYRDYRPLLKAGGFDLFVNALPSPLHTPVTIEALRAGYHVVCEKPFAVNVRDVDRMAAEAKRAKRLLAPFQNNRLQPFVTTMMEVVRSGVLGEILHVRSNCGGVLFNTGPHAVDIALLFYEEGVIPEVSCQMRFKNELGGDAEDLCALTLHTSDGPIVEIHLTAYAAYPPDDMFTVSGTRGSLAGGPQALRWKYYDAKRAPKQRRWRKWSVARAYPRETLPWVEKSWTIDAEIAAGATTGYTLPSFQFGVRMFYDNLSGVLRHGDKLLATLPQVRRQIAVIEESHRQNAVAARRARGG
jgi:scyllo-inositol 2-dehydrogenase (NADP+)